MIKFFRKIRQKLLSENKFSKYILYAIGEIVLVVIGILIALQINNWNETKKEAKVEQEIMFSLKEEIKNNIKVLKSTLKNSENNYSNSLKVLDSLESHQTSISIFSILNTLSYNPVSINSDVLNDVLKSDRRLKTKDNDFITKLRTLSTAQSYLIKNENYLDEYWNTKSSDFVIKTGLMSKINNPQFEQILLTELSKGEYNKDQIISLITLNLDLTKAWINSQKYVLRNSKKVIERL